MLNKQLFQDEPQAESNDEAIKTNLQIGVGVEIFPKARYSVTTEEQKINKLADSLLQKVGDKSVFNQREIKANSFLTRISQMVDYVFFSLYGLLALRLLLELFAANSTNGSIQLTKYLIDPFYLPFMGIFPRLTAELGLTLIVPIIIAIFVYIFVYLAVTGLLTLLLDREGAI